MGGLTRSMLGVQIVSMIFVVSRSCQEINHQPANLVTGRGGRGPIRGASSVTAASREPTIDIRSSTGEEDRSLYKSTLGTSQLHAISPSTGNSTARVDSLLSQSQVALLHTHHYFLTSSVAYSSSSIPVVKQIRSHNCWFLLPLFSGWLRTSLL
jgi:hypothetical protein